MVKIIEVLFRRAEGPSDLCGKWESFPTLHAANKHIREQSHTFSDLGYDKCDFKVKFEREDWGYDGRLDVRHPFKNDRYNVADNNIFLHVNDWLSYRLREEKMSDEERKEITEFQANWSRVYFEEEVAESEATFNSTSNQA